MLGRETTAIYVYLCIYQEMCFMFSNQDSPQAGVPHLMNRPDRAHCQQRKVHLKHQRFQIKMDVREARFLARLDSQDCTWQLTGRVTAASEPRLCPGSLGGSARRASGEGEDLFLAFSRSSLRPPETPAVASDRPEPVCGVAHSQRPCTSPSQSGSTA